MNINSDTPMIEVERTTSPIPIKDFDYCAMYSDADCEDDPIAFGPTPMAAVNELVSMTEMGFFE